MQYQTPDSSSMDVALAIANARAMNMRGDMSLEEYIGIIKGYQADGVDQTVLVSGLASLAYSLARMVADARGDFADTQGVLSFISQIISESSAK